MAKCVTIQRKHRKPCIGDLDKEIKLQGRAITPPVFGVPDFDESFTDNDTVWASINTLGGKTIFDGVSQDSAVTHEFVIRYDSTVTTETWIEFEGRRFDIVPNGVQDWEERHEWLSLLCAERGVNTNEASKA